MFDGLMNALREIITNGMNTIGTDFLIFNT